MHRLAKAEPLQASQNRSVAEPDFQNRRVRMLSAERHDVVRLANGPKAPPLRNGAVVVIVVLRPGENLLQKDRVAIGAINMDVGAVARDSP